MNRYYIVLNTDTGIYYYAGQDNGSINLTYNIDKAVKFDTKEKANQEASKIGFGCVKKEVIK